jgi:hypothetical protein
MPIGRVDPADDSIRVSGYGTAPDIPALKAPGRAVLSLGRY